MNQIHMSLSTFKLSRYGQATTSFATGKVTPADTWFIGRKDTGIVLEANKESLKELKILIECALKEISSE